MKKIYGVEVPWEEAQRIRVVWRIRQHAVRSVPRYFAEEDRWVIFCPTKNPV